MQPLRVKVVKKKTYNVLEYLKKKRKVSVGRSAAVVSTLDAAMPLSR